MTAYRLKTRPSHQEASSNRAFYVLWIFFLAILLISLVRSLWLTKTAKQAVTTQQEELQKLQQNVQVLEKKVQEATSSFTLEQRTRQELQLSKPGEEIILIK